MAPKPARTAYDRLLERRKTNNAQIVYFHKCINESESIDPSEAEIKKERLAKWADEFKANLEAIESHDDYEFNEQMLLENCQHEELLLKALSILRAVLAPKADAEISFGDLSMSMANVIRPELKLSNIDVPTFSGNYSEWQAFHELFNSLVHTNKSLAEIQRFHYLKKSLIGKAGNLIKHLPTVAANYSLAWTILIDRYHNKRALVNNFLELLTEQPKINSNSAQGVRDLIDVTNECLFGLRSLEIETDSWDPWVVYLISKKLDNDSKVAWEQYLGGSKEVPNLERIMKFLDLRARILDETSKPNVQKLTKERVRTAHIETSKSNDKPFEACSYCNGKHFIYFCQNFRAISAESRNQFVNEKKLCFNCLNTHMVVDCKSKFTCRSCKKKHNTLLHIPDTTPISPAGSEKNEQPTNVTVHCASQTMISSTLLATALISVEDRDGTDHVLRALIDQGSQATFITRTAVQLLKLPRVRTNVSVTGVGKSDEQINESAMIRIKSLVDPGFKLDINALILQKVSKLRSVHQAPPSNWTHLNDLQLADPRFMKYEKIDLLLGADIFSEIILPGLKKGKRGTPTAQNTRLGWILSGAIHDNSNKTPSSGSTIHCNHAELTIDEQLERFWQQEEIISEPKLSEIDENCIKKFKETYERDGDGRYSVEMLFKKDHITKDDLGSSRATAIARLLQMERKFEKDAKFKELYMEFMKDYLDSGHMELSEEAEEDEPVYHLPHHAVLKDSSTTTRLRAVFDASAKSSSGFSLNDWQLIGPAMQQKLLSIMLRWRIYPFVFSGDVKQMYRQVLIKKMHRNFQRILWRWLPTDPILDYTLITVAYGQAIAAFLAIMALQQTPADEEEFLRSILKSILGSIDEEFLLMILLAIIQDFYMDDLLTGEFTIEKAIIKRECITRVLEKGCFQLRKWKANNYQILNGIPEAECEMKPISLDSDPSIKTLGLYWDPYSDDFLFKINLASKFTKSLTKRIFLSESARLFDPLGWLAPCVIISKKLFQSLWKLKLDWDTELPIKLQREWFNLRDQLKRCEELRIPRWIKLEEKCKWSIHGFSDASKEAMAAVVYARIEKKDGTFISLYTAKTKVAPIEEQTIPRLELRAAVLLSELIRDVLASLRNPPDEVVAWSDSTTVLSWLKGDVSKWKQYVANRVRAITQIIKPDQWNYVSTKCNPADCASRGILPDQLLNQKIWWHGPSWLIKEREHWPEQLAIYRTKEEEKTTKSVKALNIVISHVLPEFINKYSNFVKLNRIMSYWYRFLHNSLSKFHNTNRFTGPISTLELKITQIKLVKIVQLEYFKDELKALQTSKVIDYKSSIKKLRPIWDEKHSVMRVGGRLSNYCGSTERKHPLILPPDSHLTKLIIQHAHDQTLHGGITAMHCYLRQRYWIVRGKNSIKKCFRECVRCFRNRNHAEQAPLMGNLPAPRVNPSKCFEHCGIDFAGPLELRVSLRRKAPSEKGYIAVFVCYSTKAVHLELVSSMSTPAFLAAVRRMCSRRGIPSHIYCDNGSNFIGAKNELPRLLAKASEGQTEFIINALAKNGIQWHFNPPSAPNFGGLWESVVKSAKLHLKRITHNTKLTFEEMSTFLCQVEATLNSRPLCMLSDDIEDDEPLTAGHFLIGTALNTIPEPDITFRPENRLTRWQLVQRMHQHFWQRWTNEYLNTLQTRAKWFHEKNNVKIGDIVLIKDENLPTNKWMLARITETHPGNDGVVRVVTIKTRKSTFKRPVNKLCPLPINSEDEELSIRRK